MKVLLVEDELKLGEYVKKGLSEAGFIVDHQLTGLDGYHAMTVSYTHLTLPTNREV